MQRRGRFPWAVALVASLLSLSQAGAQTANRYKAIRFDQLLGWERDDHAAALKVFLGTCKKISAPEWAPLCALASNTPDARRFFETFFVPVVVRPDRKALFTGYFEPVLSGARKRGGKYQTPIYRRPSGLDSEDMPTRAEINAGALSGQGLEIAWVDNPVDVYFLHLQGSGRINLEDGTAIRLGYSGENGRFFRSAAKELLRSGEITSAEATIEGMRAYYARNPVRGREALEHNASYVFFRVVAELHDDNGPIGALSLPITGTRSLAVDPRFTQLGAPVWIEKGGRNPIRRLMVAQDTGGAIKGPQRADIFFGTGAEAGQLAGQTRNSGRMVVLMPIDIALRLDPEG